MKIADIHTHIFPDKIAQKATASIGDFYHLDMYSPASVDRLLASGKAAGTSRFVVFTSAVHEGQVKSINDFIADACKKHPCFIGFAALFPTMEGYEEELCRIESLGLRGIKFHSDFQKIAIDDPRAIPMYRAIARHGLPVLFHMGDDRYDYSSPTRLQNLLRQVPDLRVIAAHFGGYRRWDEAYRLNMTHNVWYDTSSSLAFLSRDDARRLIDRFGPDRFFYGTDFPMWDPKEELQRFLSLGLDEQTQANILYHNFMKFFGLTDEEA